VRSALGEPHTFGLELRPSPRYEALRDEFDYQQAIISPSVIEEGVLLSPIWKGELKLSFE